MLRGSRQLVTRKLRGNWSQWNLSFYTRNNNNVPFSLHQGSSITYVDIHKIYSPPLVRFCPQLGVATRCISGRCITRLELIAIRHPSIFLPSTSENISFSPVFSWHCALIPRGLRNSFAILAALKNFDWHWHWHRQRPFSTAFIGNNSQNKS